MIKFLYLRNEKMLPIATIAYELEPKPSKKLTFNYSCCHDEDTVSYTQRGKGRTIVETSSWRIDTPNKRIGRTIAEGRLRKNPQQLEFYTSPVIDLLEHVADADSNFPRRMKRLAFRMLQERDDTERPEPIGEDILPPYNKILEANW